MRKTLLASATLAGLAILSASTARYAAAQAPDAAQPPAAMPDSAPADAPATPVPAAPPRHHHKAAASADPTHFAHEPGTGQSGPASDRASNIDSADSRSPIAPHLPLPPGGESAGYLNYLRDADRDLAAHHTGAAQQALEMAETRLLDRSTPAGSQNQPDQAAIVRAVSQARQSLGHRDIAGARAAIRMALQSAPVVR